MKFYIQDPKEFDEWKYNLLLIAPGKAESKKTVSRGFIRVDALWTGIQWALTGMATDDILSISAEILGVIDDNIPLQEINPFWIKPETLKAVTPTLMKGTGFYLVDFPEDEAFDGKHDQRFWLDHVEASINEPYQQTVSASITWIDLSPDRLRKFSLLKPQGFPMTWEFVIWQSREIIRWSYSAGGCVGIYVPLSKG